MNGQLKPAYNVQIAVENYFIVHGYVSNDRTDYNTLIPVLEKHRKAFGDKLEARLLQRKEPAVSERERDPQLHQAAGSREEEDTGIQRRHWEVLQHDIRCF